MSFPVGVVVALLFDLFAQPVWVRLRVVRMVAVIRGIRRAGVSGSRTPGSRLKVPAAALSRRFDSTPRRARGEWWAAWSAGCGA